MSPARLALAVIGDEIGPSLPEMISFCAEHQVSRLDMRTVDGRNLFGGTLTALARPEHGFEVTARLPYGDVDS